VTKKGEVLVVASFRAAGNNRSVLFRYIAPR